MKPSLDHTLLADLATAIRSLSMDAIEKAKSGHPGLPLGCAELGATLFSSILKHNPANPAWIDRDRFVLSAGHGSMFLYSLLHLFGYGLSIEDIKAFRQTGSKTPGHPEFGLTPGVEVSTGPLGAGFANAVGMAMAEKHLAATFNTPRHSVVDHCTWVLAGDGCLMEGVSAEAASLAGHLGLGKLNVFYDSNRISIEGSTSIAFTENVAKRFEAYGWQVLGSSAYDTEAIARCAAEARAETNRPTLIILESIIGKGSPHKEGSHEVHGSPLGSEEIAAAKRQMGLDPNLSFAIPPGLNGRLAALGPVFQSREDQWKQTFADWRLSNPERAAQWDLYFGDITSQLASVAWPSWKVGDSVATRSAGGACLQAIAKSLPWVFGGSADLAPSNNTDMKGFGHFQKESPLGRNLHFGVREHAMGSIVNGITLHGGLRSFGATFMVFSDYLKPSLRLSALMGIPSIWVFTHDSIWVGEDGPTHQPIEQIEMLRSIPGLEVLRPGDAEETALAWALALKKGVGAACHGTPAMALEPREGPTALLLSRQNLTVLKKPARWQEDVEAYGAYQVVQDAHPQDSLIILASGAEVGTALEAMEILAADGIGGKVISVPSQERLLGAIAQATIPANWGLLRALEEGRVWAVEAGSPRSWTCLVPYAMSIGIEGFGRSGPGKEVAALLGIDALSVAKRIKAGLSK